MKLVTTSALVERLKINGSLARAAIRELESKVNILLGMHANAIQSVCKLCLAYTVLRQRNVHLHRCVLCADVGPRLSYKHDVLRTGTRVS